MALTREKQKQEALIRLEKLTKKFDLNPHIIDYLKEDRLYYSYVTAGGMLGSIDTIKYDKRFPEIVKNFEKDGGYVYHAIQSGETLALLYVSTHEENWEIEHLEDNYIVAYVINIESPSLSETGDIFLSSLGGALVRIA